LPARRALARPFVAVALLALAGAAEVRAQIDFPDFGSIDDLRFVGTAQYSDSVIDLNGLGPKVSGAVWHYQKQPIARGFSTSFVFQISDTNGQFDAGGAMGGDGFAFVIQNGEPTPVGGAGGQLGYDGIRNSVAIEFDTYANDEPGFDDPNGNHVAIHTTGTGLNSASHSYAIASNTSIPNLSDGAPHTVSIEYINGALRIYLDGCQGLLLALPFDFERRIALDKGRAWVGFTAATGSAWERHAIRSWQFNGHPLLTPIRVSMCEGTAARLVPPGSFNTYRWSTGAMTSSIEVSRPGRYSVEVTDSLGCVPTEHTFVYDVVESTRPRPSISATDSVRLCNGSRVTLDAGPYATYLWSNGAATRQIIVTTPGVYRVSVADSLGCTGADSVYVMLAPRPSPKVTIAGPTTFCSGDSVLLDAGAGFASYRWSNGETTQRLVARDAGIYTVTVTNAEGCPATSQPVTVTVRPRPYPLINASGPTTLCRGGSVTLDAGAGYASYRWSNGATTRTIDVDTSGAFSVSVTGDNGCDGSSAPVTVTIVDPPTPEVTASPSTRLCTGDTVTLRTVIPYASYRWSTGETTPTIVVTRSDLFWVDVVDANGCAGRSDSFAVRIDSIGILKVTASGPTELCEGDAVTLTAPAGLASYRWSTGETTATIVARASGVYRLDAIDSAGCSGADSIVVRVAPRPVAATGADTTICAGTSVVLTGSGGESIAWLPTDGLSCSDCPEPVATPSQTTRYRMIAANGSGCADTAWTTVTVLPAPSANVSTGVDRRVYPGTTLDIPVKIDGPIEEAKADEFVLELDYDTSVLLLGGITLEGEMLTDWQMVPLVESPGYFSARFTSRDGRALRGGTTILTMKMQSFLGSPMRASIRPSLTLAASPCASIAAVGSSVTIDSICGIGQRLIEAFDGAFKLSPASPNPFNPTTAIVFELGLESAARLEILSMSGERVALLHNGMLGAGAHRFDWDASTMPSGLYLARAIAGEWSATRVLTLVR
jgi:hypothetical protein